MKRRSVLIAASLALGRPAAATDFSAAARGTSAGEFLDIGVGGRAMAMGGAIGAAVDDATAIYWNPAAMPEVEKRSIAFMHANYVAASYLEYLGYVHNAADYGVFGMAMQYFSAGALVQTDVSGNNIGNFFPYDLALTWSYARRIADGVLGGWSFGGSARLIDSKILSSASAGSLDAAALSPWFWNERLRLSLTAANWGGDTLVYQQARERLSGVFRAGSAWRLSPESLLTFDAAAPQSDRPYAAVGSEYWFVDGGRWRFAGRVGLKTQTFGSVDGLTGISMGFGVVSPRTAFDYAFVPVGGLGQAHRLSFSCRF